MSDIKVDYTIDSGVPIPVRTAPLPLDELKVGESVLFPIKRRGAIQGRASSIKKSTNKEFTVKRVSDTEARIWRTK